MWMKKRYILQHGDDQFAAIVATDNAGQVAVQIDDGELHDVDACFVQNGRALSLRIDGRMHLIDLSARAERGSLDATVRGRVMDVTVMDELRAMAQMSLEDAGSGGLVKAEIPGVVIAMHVEAGQKIHQGEPLLVLEAMKMQNEIAAPVNGIVEEVKVEVGQSVFAGDPLVLVTPEAGG
jgi:biotin carboxyl carrier protein